MAERPLPQQISSPAHTEYLVRPLRDREELRRMLSPQRAYAAYALGQLQPELFAQSEWLVGRGARGQALLLHSRGGLGNALFALGAADALEVLLRLHPGPRTTFLTGEEQHLHAVLRHFELPERHIMVRMLVDRDTFSSVEGATRPLTGRHVGQVNRLYRSEGTPAFYTAANIDDALYFGAYLDGALVAVAGTHVVAPADGVAVVGNVFTHPAHRGQGLGALVTNAVTKQLLTTCREVVLSVDPGNSMAVRTYKRLGYREVGRLIEGTAVRRDIGLSAFLRRRLAAVRGRRYGAELVSVSV